MYLVLPNILFLRRSKKCESLKRDRRTDEQRDVEQRVIKKVHLYIWFRWAETWISVVINALLIACLHWTRNFVSFFSYSWFQTVLFKYIFIDYENFFFFDKYTNKIPLFVTDKKMTIFNINIHFLSAVLEKFCLKLALLISRGTVDYGVGCLKIWKEFIVVSLFFLLIIW